MDLVHPQEVINISGARRFGTGSAPVLRLKIRLRLTRGSDRMITLTELVQFVRKSGYVGTITDHRGPGYSL
jgi:hypothetical protein